jgi:hypothetical protein
MLVPAKLATAEYATAARASLSSQTTLRVVADLTAEHPQAFDATVYPMAVVFNRGAPPAGHQFRGGLPGGPRSPQSTLSGAPWIITTDPIREALEHLRGDHPLLGATTRCRLGIKTGCNRVFVDPDGEVEPELMRWAIRGRDISPFQVHPHHRLLWTHAANGDPLPALPPKAHALIRRHHEALVARRDYVGGPVWTLFRATPASAGHRVVWADLARQLEAVALTGPDGLSLLPLNSCYLVALPTGAAAMRMASGRNTTRMRVAARAGADSPANGIARFNARVGGGLPRASTVRREPDRAARAESARRGRLQQEELDDVAARHLALGPAHRRALAGYLGTRTGAGG